MCVGGGIVGMHSEKEGLNRGACEQKKEMLHLSSPRVVAQ